MRFQKIAEPLRRIGGKSDIFVHMIGVDAVPFDLFVFCKRRKHLVLRGRRRKDHVDLFLFRQKLRDLRLDVPRGGVPHLRTGIANFYLQFVFLKLFHNNPRRQRTASANASS